MTATVDLATVISGLALVGGPLAAYVTVRVSLATVTQQLSALVLQVSELRTELHAQREARQVSGEAQAGARERLLILGSDLAGANEELSDMRAEVSRHSERLAKLEAMARRSGQPVSG